jgi:U3 small nucleolar RNA-associated protein 10
VRLMRAIYQLANASTSLPILSSVILQLLFSSLKDQSLAFLAGVWTDSDQEFRDLKAISLLHAAAFLEAHILEDDRMDFQTILPSIFVALHDSDAQLSQAALECISRIWILAQRPLRSVYHFDVIYGRSNGKPALIEQFWMASKHTSRNASISRPRGSETLFGWFSPASRSSLQ